jgi:hypothetical protein
VKPLRIVLLVILYLIATVVSLGVAVSPIAWSWWAAFQRDYVTEGRQQWCIIAKTPIVRGLKLADENVDWAIRRVRADDRFIWDARRVVGKYALVDLAEGDLLKSEHLSGFAPSKAPDGGAAIPVEVKTEHAGGLKPGMRLAFVQEKEKERMMIPAAKGVMERTIEPGFELLSVVTSSKDASVVTLTIAVNKTNLAYVQDLAIGQWKPVILSDPKIESNPPAR